MFTDYPNLVYGTLSLQEAKSPSEIYTEIQEQWFAAGKRGFFGGRKIPSLSAIFFALERLEREGFAKKEASRPHSKRAPMFKWRKRRNGRKVKNEKTSFFGFNKPATA